MLKKPTALVWYTIVITVGTVLALALPPNPHSLRMLDISASEYRLAVFTLILPYALIWFSAFYAYDKLERYAVKLRSTREGEAFKKIADGLGVLAWGLAVPTIIAMVLAAIEGQVPGFRPVHIIIDNYVAVLVALIGFTFIGNGTRMLTEIVRARPTSIGIRLLAAVFITVGVFFAYFVIHNQSKDTNAYYLPQVLLLLTLVVPYLYAWLVGLLGAYELRLYSLKTKGVLYQKALVWLAGGITIVVIGSIMVQYLDGVFAGRDSVSLGSLLAIIYGLLIVQALGYSLIALGAKRLMKIEEV